MISSKTYTYSSFLDETDKKYFKLAVQNIGKESNVDISAKCPVCGDSSSKNSKRLHLYVKNGTTLVHCFNGDCTVNNNMYNFLRIYFPDLLHSYRREKFNVDMYNLMKPESTEYSTKQISIERKKPQTFNYLDKWLVESKIEPLTDECYEFLFKRNIEPQSGWYFCSSDLTIDGIYYKTKNSIMIPLMLDGLMYGFYSRNITEKFFATFIPSVNNGFKIWNYFNIDLDIPVYIFEGIFDALSSGKKNCIALMGSTITQERLDEIKQPIFCFDNDKTGLIQSYKYLEQSPQAGVFIFPEEIQQKDLNELLKIKSREEISTLINNCTYFGLTAKIKLKMIS